MKFKDNRCFLDAWLRPGRLITMVALGYWLSGANMGQSQEFRLVKKGQPLASIVVASNAGHAAVFAAQELQDHIQKITGARLPVETDIASVKGAKICVGESAVTKTMGLRSSDFQPQEYLVRVAPDQVILMGRDDPAAVPDFVQPHGELASADGKFGKGLKFSKGAVTVTSFEFPDKEGTFEFWLWTPAQLQKGFTVLWVESPWCGIADWTYHSIGIGTNNTLNYTVFSGGTNGACVDSGRLAEGWHYVKTSHSLAGNKITLAVDSRVRGEAPYRLPTHCSGARMNIGGRPSYLSYGTEKISGSSSDVVLDEIRVSKITRSSETNIPATAFSTDPDTLLLLHFDEGTTEKINDSSGMVWKISPPDMFKAQGTCYAVYDFLERCCGVRWYMPGDLGMVFTPSRTLAVKGVEIRRRPQFIYRDIPRGTRGITAMAWNRPVLAELDVFWCRMRLGGENIPINHSFYGYYDRFWKKNPDCPEVFEGEHPEYFAAGTRRDKDKQLCYSNSNLIFQVARDACDYFDGKGLKQGARAAGQRYFALVPMDHRDHCKCPACRDQLTPSRKINRFFSNGCVSDYIWRFVNAVAGEVKKSHPDKYITALAYYDYAYYPEHVQLETNILVSLCLVSSHGWPKPESREADMVWYREWMEKEKGRRPFTLWLYYNPEEGAEIGNFHCFPPFYAHTLSDQFKLFARDGILGMFLCGDGFPVLDKYLVYKLMDDPAQNVDQTLHEFFERFYGPAGKPMETMYLKIEAIYNDPKNWPTNANVTAEERCWGYMGTEERMTELGRLMEQAKKAGGTELERKRVEVFETSVWNYMVEGPKLSRKNLEQKRKMDQLRKTIPFPQIKAPRLNTPLKGEIKNMDWSQAAVVTNWYTILGDPTNRPATARLLHDGEFLYIQLTEAVATSKLISKDVFAGDDWELFFARERGKDAYNQLGIAPNGEFKELSFSSRDEWRSGVILKSDLSKAGEWVLTLAMPLEHLLPGGVKAGQKIYMNIYRQCSVPKGLFAWSPNFEANFHKLDRLGELTLE